MDHILKVILKKRKNNEEWTIRRKLLVEQKDKKLKFDTPSVPFYVAIFDRTRSVRKKEDFEMFYQISLQKIKLTFHSPHKYIRVLCLKLTVTNKGKREVIPLNTYPYKKM